MANPKQFRHELQPRSRVGHAKCQTNLATFRSSHYSSTLSKCKDPGHPREFSKFQNCQSLSNYVWDISRTPRASWSLPKFQETHRKCTIPKILENCQTSQHSPSLTSGMHIFSKTINAKFQKHLNIWWSSIHQSQETSVNAQLPKKPQQFQTISKLKKQLSNYVGD